MQRAWINSEPPRRKTFFLIRHGQSKWNEAQSKINIGGMLLDSDHALTELGVEQAEALNHRWKEFEEIRHAEIAHSPKKAQRPLPETKSSPTNCVFGSKILCSFFSLL